MNALESGLISSDELVRRTGGSLIRNSGKIVAVITSLAAILLTFTDVRLGSVVGNELTGELVMMLVAAYLMYFSLEDAGERLGKQTKEYECAAEEYAQMRRSVSADDTEALRDFCIRYAEEELDYRRRAMLAAEGLSPSEMKRWQEGEAADKRARRVFRRVAAMKAVSLTPQVLLSSAAPGRKSELTSPERFKIRQIVTGLLPTTLGMILTVSVMLSVKDGLTAEGVIEGLIKLATLPIVGFRGYVSGYAHVREHGVAWLEARTRILKIFKGATPAA